MTPPVPDHAPPLDGLRFGKRRVTKMYAEVNELRRAIAAEGSDRIQRAWDRVEEHLDFAYQQAAERRASDEALEAGAMSATEYVKQAGG